MSELDVFGSYEDIVDCWFDFNSLRVFKSAERPPSDPWVYHNWYKVVQLHKEFEKEVLVTLDIDHKIISTCIPKSIIGKKQTTVDYKHRSTEIQYLIYIKSLEHLPKIDVVYSNNGVYYKFINLSATGYALVTALDTEVPAQLLPDELKYEYWRNR